MVRGRKNKLKNSKMKVYNQAKYKNGVNYGKREVI